MPALQLRWSAEVAHQRALPRLVWVPGEGETTDERQRAFLTEAVSYTHLTLPTNREV